MKKPEPNALRRELARSQHAGPHPDADLLTAFEEGTLSKRERDQLVKHLAVCVDCREVLSLSVSSKPESLINEPGQVAARLAHTPFRAWRPWVTVAASGVIIVGSTILLYDRRREPREHLVNNTNLTAKTTVQAPALPEKPLQAAQAEDLKAPHKKSAPGPASRVVPPSQKPLTTTKYADQARIDESQALQANSRPIGGPVAAGISQAQQRNRAFSTPSTLAFSNTSQESAQTETPNKPARPQWRINAMGQAERSYGGGTWQVVLPKDKMHVIAIFGNEVWTGGENRQLYHSSDNGTTWTPVTLPAKDGDNHTITHIRFQTPQNGTVQTEDSSSWTTIDGGKTWR